MAALEAVVISRMFCTGGCLHARADWGGGGLRGRVGLLRCAPCCGITVRPNGAGGEPSGKVGLGAQHQSTPALPSLCRDPQQPPGCAAPSPG